LRGRALGASREDPQGEEAEMIGAVVAAALAFGPFETAAAPLTREAKFAAPRAPAAASSSHFELAYAFYQSVISPIDGPRCAHRPTCSRYALLAVRQEGPLLGMLLTIDRLMRGGDSSALRKLRLFKDG